MTETKFNDFTSFFERLNLTTQKVDFGIFVLDINEISESAIEQFSMYRNEFYEINITKGQREFRFKIDGATYEPNGTPYVCFVAPNQLQSFEVIGEDKEAQGFLIYIRKSIFKQIEQVNKNIRFFSREYESYYELRNTDYHELIPWVLLMKKEIMESHGQTPEVLKNLLTILLLKCKALTKEAKSILYNRPQIILHTLLEMIENSESLKTVAHYASELALTPKQLNRITKTILGKTTQTIIREHTNEKAKALLVQSNYTVSEIAHQLGFEESSNFSRFFKGLNGLSPKDFLAQNGVN